MKCTTGPIFMSVHNDAMNYAVITIIIIIIYFLYVRF